MKWLLTIYIEFWNYFYDNVTTDAIYLYGFKFSDTKILPPVRERDNEIIFPQMARKNFLNYFANINAKVTQFQERIDLVTGERSRKNIGDTIKKLKVILN